MLGRFERGRGAGMTRWSGPRERAVEARSGKVTGAGPSGPLRRPTSISNEVGSRWKIPSRGAMRPDVTQQGHPGCRAQDCPGSGGWDAGRGDHWGGLVRALDWGW